MGKRDNDEGVRHLRQLTDIFTAQSENTVEYELATGTAILFKLHANKHAAVARVFVSKGTHFPAHSHSGSKEIVIITKGGGTIKVEKNSPIVLQVGSVHQVSSNEEHYFTADADTWLIAITIPPDVGYPGVPDKE